MDQAESKSVGRTGITRSHIVPLVVERGEDGLARIVLEGVYMDATGFAPGDRVEAIVQPELISILVPE